MSHRLPPSPPHFLLVEDDPGVATAYRRSLQRYGAVSTTASVTDAIQLVNSARLTGVVADVGLPDGSGLDLAREARARSPDLPILLISGSVDATRLDAADELRASYLVKPVDSAQLARFAARAVARQDRAAQLVRVWADRYGLSATEAATLTLALDGLRRENIAAHRGVSPNTVKHQISSLLAKTGTTTLAELTHAFLHQLVDAG